MPRVRTALLITATLAATTLSACASGGDSGGPGGAAAPPSPTRTTGSDSAAPAPRPVVSVSPRSAAPSLTAAPSAAGERPGRHKVGLLQPRLRTAADPHLLPAQRLPVLGDGTWTVASTAPDDPASAPAVGACQKTGLGTIGAVTATRRTYRADGGVRATQVVARFADARSAWRAHQVLTAWREDCEQRLGLPAASVGPLEPVTVVSGVADSYRTATRQQPSRRSGLGILRAGDTIVLVEVAAPLDTYPRRWDPARVVVRRAARTF